MSKEIADTILGFIIYVGIFVIILIIYGFAYCNGENNIIQKLCTQKQYDFCDVIKTKTEYKLKELKQDE